MKLHHGIYWQLEFHNMLKNNEVYSVCTYKSMWGYKVEYNISTSLEINHQKLEEKTYVFSIEDGGLIVFGLHAII